MGWAISTYSMTSIHSFESAKKHWETMVPWRNQHASWRQLDGRKQPHKHLVKLHDDKGYECVLFSTPLVTYFADGSVKLASHGSMSSHAFAWMCRPNACSPTTGVNGTMFWNVSTDEGEMYYHPRGNDLLLHPTDRGKWRLDITTEPKRFYKMQYDPKLGAEVRKKLKPFTQWAELTIRLLGRRYSTQWHYDATAHAARFLENPFDTEHYPGALDFWGSPAALLKDAYLATGARYSVPIPFTELPRNQR